MKIIAFLIFLLPILAGASPPNWGGKYAPCSRHADLLSRRPVDLAVRISTANTVLAQQFERALDFWSEVLDLGWHIVDSEDCAVQLVDGMPSLFNFCACMSARAQLPDRTEFQGWIAFNPRMKLTKHEMFLDSVHEIGHLLGLAHNPDNSSVMFNFGGDQATSLDSADLDGLALRYPRLKTNLYGMDALTPQEAFTGTPKARIGAHNDCFLASNTDWGTWSKNVVAEKAFYHEDNLFVPQGGETCNFKEDAQPFIGCENALRELAFQRFNTLNSRYHLDVLDSWTKGGCMPEIRRRLGYRFRLVASSTKVEGKQLQMSVTVHNDGFANLYNPRPVVLVLRDRATGRIERVPVDTDPRRWMPSESTTFRITTLLAPGEYDLLLQLPDAAPSLRDRPEFAVRFANPGVWEPATGMNRLAETAVVGR